MPEKIPEPVSIVYKGDGYVVAPHSSGNWFLFKNPGDTLDPKDSIGDFWNEISAIAFILNPLDFTPIEEL